MNKIVLNGQEVPIGGVGLPSGGDQGQILAKASGENYDAEWTDAPDQVLEYDQTVDGCEWHVRKWSGGYVEMSAILPTGSITSNQWGQTASGLYSIDNITAAKKLPVTLTKRYSFQFNISSNGNNAAFCGTSNKTGTDLTHIPSFAIFRQTAASGSWNIHVFVTGAWKADGAAASKSASAKEFPSVEEMPSVEAAPSSSGMEAI